MQKLAVWLALGCCLLSCSSSEPTIMSFCEDVVDWCESCFGDCESQATCESKHASCNASELEHLQELAACMTDNGCDAAISCYGHLSGVSEECYSIF